MARNRFGFSRAEMAEIKGIKKKLDKPKTGNKKVDKKNSDEFVEASLKFLLG